MAIEVSNFTRILLCILKMGQIIFTLFSILDLYEKSYTTSFLILTMLSQFISNIVSIVNLFLNSFVQLSFREKFLWEFLYLLPNKELESVLNPLINDSLRQKQIFHVVLYSWFMILAIFYEDNLVWIATSMINGFLLMAFKGICNKQLEDNTYDLDINMASVLQTCYGYFILCHRSPLILMYYGILFSISVIIYCTKLTTKSHFNPFYENQTTHYNHINDIFINSIGMHFGKHKRMIFKEINCLDQKEEEIKNLQMIINHFLRIWLLIFDLLINPQNENVLFRSALQLQVILQQYKLPAMLKWLYNYLDKGPFSRKIMLFDYEVQNLSSEEIVNDYMKIKPQQKYIYLQTQDMKGIQIAEIISILLTQDKNIEIIYNQIHSLIVDNNRFSKQVQINSNLNEFTDIMASVIHYHKDSLRHHKFIIFPTNQDVIQMSIQRLFVYNLDLFANLQWNKCLLSSKLNIFLRIILMTIMYDRLILPEMISSPCQVLYDLYEDIY